MPVGKRMCRECGATFGVDPGRCPKCSSSVIEEVVIPDPKPGDAPTGTRRYNWPRHKGPTFNPEDD